MSTPGRTENQQTSRDAGLYAYSRVVGSLLLFAALIVGARVYSKDEFAYLAAILLLYETAMALGSLGLADAVFYFIGRDPSAAPRVVRQTTLLLVLAAVPVVALVVLVGHATSIRSVDVTAALPWLGLVLLIELPTQPAINQLIASGHAGLASAVYVGFAVLRLAAVVTPGLAGLSIALVPVAMAAAAGARLLLYAGIVRRHFPLGEGVGRQAWARRGPLREILWFAVPAGLGMIAGRLNPQIDKYAASVFFDEHAFAHYTFAAYELPLITLVPYAIAAVMQARYVRLYTSGRIDELRALWFATVRKTALLVVPLAMLLVVLGREAVILMGGPKYAEAALPFQLYTLIILHRVAGYGAILQSTGQTRAIMVASLLLVATNILLTLPMTRLLGYPGPALASVLSVIPPWIFTLSRIGAVMGGGIRGALPWGFYGRVLLLSGGLAGVVWAASRPIAAPAGVILLGGAVVYLAGFVVLGRLLGLVDREDLCYVLRWLTLRLR
jgi:O-antigen/teichoic acid export membrane protein